MWRLRKRKRERQDKASLRMRGDRRGWVGSHPPPFLSPLPAVGNVHGEVVSARWSFCDMLGRGEFSIEEGEGFGLNRKGLRDRKMEVVKKT